MEFKIIASLIKQKNFSAAKVGLLELISKKINLENDFKNICLHYHKYVFS